MRVLCAVCCVLCAGLTGCESLERKFTRKPKNPEQAPSPIITFQDYTRAMTPLDRYRKHYLMFKYWNDELLGALQSPSLNSKRLKRSSTEALAELQTLEGLIVDELAAHLAPLLDARAKIDRQLRSIGFSESQAQGITRTLEAQTRQIDREFSWRDVQDRLKTVTE